LCCLLDYLFAKNGGNGQHSPLRVTPITFRGLLIRCPYSHHRWCEHWADVFFPRWIIWRFFSGNNIV